MAARYDMIRGVYRRQYSNFVTGRRICAVSMEAEAWFWRLHTLADDWGNLDADPDMMPRAAGGRREVGKRDSERWFAELCHHNLIKPYYVRCNRFATIVDFTDTQPAPRSGHRIRRFPTPNESSEQCVTALNSAEQRLTAHRTGDGSDSGICLSSGVGVQRKGAEIPEPLLGEGFAALWCDYIAFRVEKGKRFKPRGETAALTRLAGWGVERAMAAIRFSMANGWDGIFEEQVNGKQNQTTRDNWRDRKTAREFKEDIKVRILKTS